MPDPSEPASKARRGVNGGEAVLGDGRKVELADFPERVAARLLDPVVVCLFVLAGLVIALVDHWMTAACLVSSYCERRSLDDPVLRGDVERLNLIVSMVVFGVLVLYEMARIGTSGQTWGKRRRRVRVVTRRDGAAPSPERALVRGLVPAAAGAVGCVGAALADLRVPALAGLALWLVVYVSAMWGRNGRGWHDMAAGTVVINDPVPQPSQTDESRL